MAKFYTAEELCESTCLRSGDLFLRNKGLYLDCVQEVYNDMNEDVLKISDKIKIPVRYQFFVDKRTNSVLLPKKMLKLCSVSSVDRHGHFHPLYRNDNIPTDIVDMGESHNCSCENECSYSLCNTIKGYEAVQTVQSDYLPNGTPISFTCTDRKMVDDNGFFYSQTQYPLRVYLSGVWTDTILYTEDKKLCQLEIDDNGCVCDTDQNLDLVCNACGIQESSIAYGGDANTPPVCHPDADTWVYYCGSKAEWFNVQCGGYPYRLGNGFNNIYNISQDGNRLIFPHNFGWDKVMIRFYEDIDLQDIRIPYLAANCFRTGLQFYSTTNNDKKQQLAALYEQKFTKQKWGLFLELNKNTIAELSQTFTPRAFVPSFIETHHHHGYYY